MTTRQLHYGYWVLAVAMAATVTGAVLIGAFGVAGCGFALVVVAIDRAHAARRWAQYGAAPCGKFLAGTGDTCERCGWAALRHCD